MILVSGCSWSDKDFKSNFHPEMEQNYPKWFDYINTEEKVLSIAKCGNSNDTIIDNATYEVLTNNDITKVVIALTEWTRFNFFYQELHPALIVLKGLLEKKKNRNDRQEKQIEQIEGWISSHNSYVDLTKLKPNVYVPYLIERLLLKLYTLQEVCKSKSIELYVFQMVWPLFQDFEEMALQTLIKNDLFHKLYSEDNYIGFPFIRNLNGESAETILKRQSNYKDLTVSEIDKHPNGAGHKVIGEWFNEQVDLS